MALTYPARRFAGSQNPNEFFGNVNAPKDRQWQPQAFENPGAGPTQPMFESVKRTTGQEWENTPQPLARFGGPTAPVGVRASMAMLGLQSGNDPNSLRDNLARGQQVVNARRSAMQREVMTGRAASGQQLGGANLAARGMQVGASQLADHTPWGDFFTALVGKEANTAGQGKQLRTDVTGIGRWKAEDPVLGKVYDLQSGETPPGFRRDKSGAAVGYLPHEAGYIAGSAPAQARWRRYNRGI